MAKLILVILVAVFSFFSLEEFKLQFFGEQNIVFAALPVGCTICAADANKNGTVDNIDRNICTGCVGAPKSLCPVQACDVDSDGDIDAADDQCIYFANLEVNKSCPANLVATATPTTAAVAATSTPATVASITPTNAPGVAVTTTPPPPTMVNGTISLIAYDSDLPEDINNPNKQISAVEGGQDLDVKILLSLPPYTLHNALRMEIAYSPTTDNPGLLALRSPNTDTTSCAPVSSEELIPVNGFCPLSTSAKTFSYVGLRSVTKQALGNDFVAGTLRFQTGRVTVPTTARIRINGVGINAEPTSGIGGSNISNKIDLTVTLNPPSSTTNYALSENKDDLNQSRLTDASKWSSYTKTPTLISNYKLKGNGNLKPGDVVNIYVRFKSNLGVVDPPYSEDPYVKSIKYLGPNPVVENIVCGFDSTRNTGTNVEIIGRYFGARDGSSKIQISDDTGTKDATITSWGEYRETPEIDDGVSSATPSATPTTPACKIGVKSVTYGDDCPDRDKSSYADFTCHDGEIGRVGNACVLNQSLFTAVKRACQDRSSCSGSPTPIAAIVPSASENRWKIAARIDERKEGRIEVSLTANGKIVERIPCLIDLTSASLSLGMECRQAGSPIDKIRAQVYENIQGAKPLYDQKDLTVDTDGTVLGFEPKLEVNKWYVAFVKAPKTVAIKIGPFQALEGTTILDKKMLPLGDIAPVAGPDGVINALDKSELSREWATMSDVSRAGDFNNDNRINSLDYSCMRRSLNATDEKFNGPYQIDGQD